MSGTKLQRIYLDYAAGTPADDKVVKAMAPYMSVRFGNPGSIHLWGQEAQVAIDESRKKVADFLGCGPREVIFTGSATEADNLAIKGVIYKILGEEIFLHKQRKPHIIVSAIEHKAVLESCHYLEDQGLADVTYLSVNQDGLLQVDDLERTIREETVLVSIMYANNEIGTIQPIREIGVLLKKINRLRSADAQFPGIIFHTDAVQALNYLDCNVDRLGVDLLALSGHKIYGPKGVGALYIRKGTKIAPIIHGGGQEYDLRAGTENVAAITGLGQAIAEIKNQKPKTKNIERLRNKLAEGILKKISNTHLNGARTRRLPNIVNISFNGAEGESIVIALDQAGVGVSTGSACSAKALMPSHVIMAISGSEEVAHSSVRFSLGKYTTEKEIDYVLKILPEIIKKLREISGRK